MKYNFTSIKFTAVALMIALLMSCFGMLPIVANDNIDLGEKVYCYATLDQNFSDNEIIIVMMPQYRNKAYTVGDFSEVDCIAIRDLWYDEDDPTECRIMLLTLSKHSKQNVLDCIKVLEQRIDLESAEPNYQVELCEEPNDAKYVADKQWAIDQISLPAAWDITTGSSTVYVGVIDTGIDASHPDLVNRVNRELSRGFTDYSDDPFEDNWGHGTKVARVIGAQGNNSIGVVGTCWNVQLVSLRVVDYNVLENKEELSSDAILDAIEYADDMGIPILNMSFGGYSTNYYRNTINSYFGLVVCAAGNENNDNDVTPHYPSDNNDLPNVISVGASNKYDKQWTYTDDEGVLKGSNYGITKVDLFAPGASVYTTHVDASYGRSSGTSIAAPYVAGVAALLLSKYPTISAAHMKYCIMIGVDIITDSNGDSVFGELCVSGGRLNAYKALTLAEDHYAHAYTVYRYYSPIKHVRTCTICNADEYAHHSAAALMQSAW